MATLRQQIATNVLTVTKFRDLMKTMQANRPLDDLDLVKKAYDYSLKHHAGQSRASGEPYLVHPLEVALVLTEMKMDSVAVAAGLLHDSVEDTSVTIVDIRKEFGEQVAHIVEGVTKISKIDFATKEEQQAENLRKMMLAMIDDIRVILIKLADRLHNMRTVRQLDQDDANVIDHGEHHLAQVLGLLLFLGGEVDLADLGDTFDDMRNLLAELLADVDDGDRSIFDRVVEQPSRYRNRIHLHLGEDQRDFQGMHEIGLAGGAALSGVMFQGVVVGFLDQFQIVQRPVGLHGLHQVAKLRDREDIGCDLLAQCRHAGL